MEMIAFPSPDLLGRNFNIKKISWFNKENLKYYKLRIKIFV